MRLGARCRVQLRRVEGLEVYKTHREFQASARPGMTSTSTPMPCSGARQAVHCSRRGAREGFGISSSRLELF